MRALPVVMGLLLATAFVTLVPAADARADTCVGTSSACPGIVCQDANGDRKFTTNECVTVDRCEYQSDCCSTTSFWCPETE